MQSFLNLDYSYWWINARIRNYISKELKYLTIHHIFSYDQSNTEYVLLSLYIIRLKNAPKNWGKFSR